MTQFSDNIILNSPTDVDLKRHAVIEASAGTGKTFTLIELVMRLLIEQRMPLESILLVTFTDQAAGELKARIRNRIQKTLLETDIEADTKNHLEQCLLQINQASVFTIHGFCHGALKEFAFEQRSVFEAEVINDKEVRQRMLRQMKRDWVADEKLLKQLKAYCKNKKIQQIDDLIIDLAEKYKYGYDAIYPTQESCSEAQLWSVFNDIERNNEDVWKEEFLNLSGITEKTALKLWQQKVIPIIEKLKSVTKQNLLSFLASFNHGVNDKFTVEKVMFFRAPKIYDSNKTDCYRLENEKIAPQLFSLITALNKLLDMFVVFDAGKNFSVIPTLLTELHQKTQNYKRDRGLISYGDMITTMWQHLESEQLLPINEQLLTLALRRKYQVAMIDEFQDTDIRQWKIFEHLFLNAANKTHHLWVIGDPKQAIYGFRGADLHTYTKATSDIVSHYGGQAYRLTTNYRTTKELINEFNRFFSGSWFDAEDVKVSAPSQADFEPPEITQNHHQLKPINSLLVKLNNADEMKSELAVQIARSIKYQLINHVEIKLKSHKRWLNASDICILVRSKDDAQYIEDALKTMDIPFSFHKKQNLYQSIEAIHLQVILTALARPNDHKRLNNALVTLFFNLKPDQLSDFAEEKLSQVNQLWLLLKEAVSLRDWVRVFDLLLNDSGALFRARHNTRRVANLKQLKQQLLQVALRNNFGANALLKTFEQWRINKSGDEDLHHKDTEQQAVKIMTMHISKGLEFPVVFLFGGFSHSDKSTYIQFYDVDQQGLVFDLMKKHLSIYQEQQLKEARQLYYVAMTRAVYMLFLPFVDQFEKPVRSPGLYVKTVLKRMQELGIEKETQVIIEQNEFDQTKSSETVDEDKDIILLELPKLSHTKRRTLHSFSSLSHLKTEASHSFIESDFAQNLTSELSVSNQSEAGQFDYQQPNQIPGGVKTGLVLHGIFENVDFQNIGAHSDLPGLYRDSVLMSVIDQQMKTFKLENKPLFNETGAVISDFRQQLADWTWHTLKKPLKALEGMSLSSLTPDDKCHELSFFWNHGSTHLTGFIDLLFAIKNDEKKDYYILDWKSNYSANGYAPDVLNNEVMKKHQYHWQYQLYALAIQDWFDSLNLENARLKGALYLFSRGINCLDSTQNGVFYDDFSNKNWQLSEVKSELLGIDRNRGLG